MRLLISFLSANINEVRTAQQIGTLLFLPFVVIYLLSELNITALNNTNLLIVASVVLLSTWLCSSSATPLSAGKRY
jgi:type III secretory pathway component EscR